MHLNALSTSTDISLIDPQPSLKLCHELTHLSHTTLETSISESQAQSWCNAHNITFHRARSSELSSKSVTLDNGEQTSFDACYISSAARPFLPKVLHDTRFAHGVLRLRDTDSVQRLKERLVSAGRVVVVRDGGIWMETVHEMQGCEIVWIVKGSHIGGSFFDQEVAEFIHSLRYVEKEATGGGSAIEQTGEGACTDEKNLCVLLPLGRIGLVDASVQL